ncbi:histidine kinase [Thermopolyspora sp. NPDC052614]|uniref:sensor histidine kinase n=1 Tax=Thermopolyspora sp. NPDC052614 TaxID=3155682 RepID=UPI0034194E68
MAGSLLAPGRALALPPWRLVASAWPWRCLVYLAGGALVGFGVLLCVASTAVVFAVLLVPLWVAVVAPLERRRLRSLGLVVARGPRVVAAGASPYGRVGAWLREPATWRETAWCLLLAIIGVVNAVVVLATGGLLVPLLGAPLLAALGLLSDAGVKVTSGWEVPALFAAGLVVLVACCYLWTALAVAEAALARALLSGREEELAERLAEARRSRVTLADAFEHERRRIERDLHDGAQERLVALALTLGLADLELAGCPPAARELVARARTQAEEALVALRATVRGIHPRVLADHGLEAAVREVADRAPIPVSVEVDVPRLPAGVESAAYFVVTEALTNVVRHSGASHAAVTAMMTARVTADRREEAPGLVVTVRDDGRGGAAFTAGGGLAGLRERVAVYDGTLTVRSPAGGPTVVTAVMPVDRHDALEPLEEG